MNNFNYWALLCLIIPAAFCAKATEFADNEILDAVFAAPGLTYQVHFNDMTGVDYDYDLNSLYKHQADGNVNGIAYASNVISDERDITLEYSAKDIGETKAFGWTTKDYLPGLGAKSIKYAFFFDRRRLKIVYNGTLLSGSFGTLAEGTRLEINFNSRYVIFKNNGVVVYQKNASADGLLAAAHIFDEGGTIQGLISNINHEYLIRETVAEVTQTSGSVSVVGVGAPPTKEVFFWGDEFVSRAEFNTEIADLEPEFLVGLGADPYEEVFQVGETTVSSNLPRKYTLQYYQDAAAVSKDIWLGYPLDIIKSKYVTQDGSSLTSTKVGAWITHDVFFYGDNDGWVTFNSGAKSDETTVGLFDFDRPADGMQYGFQLDNGKISFLDKGVLLGGTRDYKVDDEFVIELVDGRINYYVNGNVEESLALSSSIVALQMKTTFANEGSYIKKVKHSSKPFSVRGVTPCISVNHLECDGTGLATMSAYLIFHGAVSLANLNFRWIEETDNSSILVGNDINTGYSWVNVDHAGSYKLIITDPNSFNEILWQGYVDVGYKHDWIEESDYLDSPIFDNTGYNSISYESDAPIFYTWGVGQGHSKLTIGREGWIEFDVQAPESIGGVELNWSNSSNNNNLSGFSAQKYTGANVLYYGVSLLDESENGLIEINNLKSIKIIRSNDKFRAFLNYSYCGGSELILEKNISGLPALRAFVDLSGLKITRTYSSYPCANTVLNLYSQMSRDMDGELHIMPKDKLRIVYNESYETNEIEKLELVRNNEIVDITSVMPSPQIQRGDNRLLLETAQMNLDTPLEVDEVVILRLTSKSNETYYLRIKLAEAS